MKKGDGIMKVTVRDLIETLQKVEEEDLDKEIISIGTYCGYDKPCEYSLRLEDWTEIKVGERK